ncbi:BgTH12-06435 [Blumeria graminis f. sp. triticale]|uniref:BgTH12-06435 n=1 Tax=Blumeria graminis f. sp. triticale TaxID=1689686 RepID=A0A9W4CY54_BLUGR|nr:BgTH12-06435 [Blumeria graminis f. sp. triticale]
MDTDTNLAPKYNFSENLSSLRFLIESKKSLFTPEVTVAILVVLTVPLLLHLFIFRSANRKSLPSIVLLGPCDSGKSSLLALLEGAQNVRTYTSQLPATVELSLPDDRVAGSTKYRSINDPTNLTCRKFSLTDTPGHGKLRYYALEKISAPQALSGVIFMVDAASLKSNNETLRHTAEYLHDLLLALKKRAEQMNTDVTIPVLIAANKLDLFTALPAPLVRKTLEDEVSKIQASKSKGLLSSEMDTNEEGMEEKEDWIVEKGSSNFKFSQLEEFGISLEVHGGHISGDKPSIDHWLVWISERL